MAKQDSSLKALDRTKLERPRKYYVVMHNDDFTPMDFVTMILMRIFRKDENHALELMLHIHNSGMAVIGEYVLDVAVTLKEHATEIARKEGYPLKITVEKENFDLPF